MNNTEQRETDPGVRACCRDLQKENSNGLGVIFTVGAASFEDWNGASFPNL